MKDDHKELCERLRRQAGTGQIGSADADSARRIIESQAARIQQQALEYVSLFDQCSAALARVARLEKERDAMKADTERYFFLKRQAKYDPKMDGRHVWYSIPMRNPNGGRLIGNTLDASIDAALQAEKERE